ncbi:6655_t:CDS:2 [Cetraspora pellucida]|uniref:6655_t:CDS:1 n=1 Tax=Cetraspora pellucida TaxID=1433469 RepID=A0A9N8ZZ13_9GLOM|nr:6655_t:CDS:2 [Cetraspora pellucida]
MSNKWGCPKCTISEFFVEVPEDDGKPKFWNSSDKEMACTFCLKKNENSFENLKQRKEIHLLACLNAPSDLRQEFQDEVNNIEGKLLNTTANKLQTKTIKTSQSAKVITLTFNDISSERSFMKATIKLVKDLLIEDELKDVKIIAVVTNLSSRYAATSNQFKDTPLQFWKYVEEEAPELAFIINSANVEQLFSDMSFIHSKRRVRLNEKKVIKIAQLQANQHKENMKRLDSKKLNNMQIHAQKKSSINNMNMNNEVSVNVKFSTNQMIEETNSSNKEIESELILDELNYTRVVNEWFIELDNEVYETKDYDLNNTEILHLAEDPQAKWNLNTLFSSTLSNLLSIEL